MFFCKENSMLYINDSFEIKKVYEKNNFLIKIFDITTKYEYTIGSFDNIESQDKAFKDLMSEIAKFHFKEKDKYIVINFQ